jgi:NADH-quinone oxidoreductase subunit C
MDSPIAVLLKQNFPELEWKVAQENTPNTSYSIPATALLPVCRFLKTNSECYFDSLSCITAVDLGIESNLIELIYQLYSIPFEKSFTIKIQIPRSLELAIAPSVSSLWKTAEWHEREAFDFFGIQFLNHPDLRRILLPNDWNGFPLRKDYTEAELYHEIKIAY